MSFEAKFAFTVTIIKSKGKVIPIEAVEILKVASG
jgi:hypothetical protein